MLIIDDKKQLLTLYTIALVSLEKLSHEFREDAKNFTDRVDNFIAVNSLMARNHEGQQLKGQFIISDRELAMFSHIEQEGFLYK